MRILPRNLFLCFVVVCSAGAGFSEPVVRPRILGRKPHDQAAFTQGLLIDKKSWLESTGLYGKSELREIDRENGKVLQMLSLPAEQFGEGLALLDGKLYQLTWRAGTCRVIDRETFKLLKTFPYAGEGWGLASDGQVLYLSDGTSVIRVMDPQTFKEVRRFQVQGSKGPLVGLNELEWIEGELWGNIYGQKMIARIHPQSGKVIGFVDLRHLPMMMDQHQEQDVLNGIARDPESGEIWVTGKFWKALYQIEWPVTP
ncbi:glutaminyl-peptide cyclotransferase [Kiritimatiellaeota bacterium B1221]|nr:glutaminyl-peptide cyclotransferase [Kiritimatiellaeota bacterium B1221]